MKIIKVINNNVVSCLDNHNKEVVVMGKGLGFHTKPGENINMAAVEKVFRMDSMEEFTRLKDLFARLPVDLLEVCSQIIEYANQTLGHRLNESIYVTLTDHIQFAIERSNNGTYLHNALNTEVKVFYPKEYGIGKYALEYIKSKQGVTLPEDEAASVALHLINAEFDTSMNVTMKATQVLKPMVQILETWPGLKLDRGNIYYDELLVNLKFLAMQVFANSEKDDWGNTELIHNLQKSIPDAFACAQSITSYLIEQCGHAVSLTEQAYLAICIRRACKS